MRYPGRSVLLISRDFRERYEILFSELLLCVAVAAASVVVVEGIFCCWRLARLRLSFWGRMTTLEHLKVTHPPRLAILAHQNRVTAKAVHVTSLIVNPRYLGV
jgi:hypothetical protein